MYTLYLLLPRLLSFFPALIRTPYVRTSSRLLYPHSIRRCRHRNIHHHHRRRRHRRRLGIFFSYSHPSTHHLLFSSRCFPLLPLPSSAPQTRSLITRTPRTPPRRHTQFSVNPRARMDESGRRGTLDVEGGWGWMWDVGLLKAVGEGR